jgi:hypothetical protein
MDAFNLFTDKTVRLQVGKVAISRATTEEKMEKRCAMMRRFSIACPASDRTRKTWNPAAHMQGFVEE